MENYFNDMLEYQEAVKVGIVPGYKSDWPDDVSEEETPGETPEEETPEEETPVTDSEVVSEDELDDITGEDVIEE